MLKYRLSLIALLFGAAASQAQISGPICKNGLNPITGERCANAVTSAVPFLRITPDARGGGMGDVGIATSADPNGMHYNASKIAFSEKKSAISATFTPWMRNLGINDVYLAYLSGYYRIDKFQAIAASLRYFSLGNIQFVDINQQSLGDGKPNEWEISAAYTRKLTDNFSAAIGAKYIQSNLANGQILPEQQGTVIKPGQAGAADISFTYSSPLSLGNNKTDLTVGLAISNLGSKITYTNSVFRDYLPANLGLGYAWTFRLDDYNTLTWATDFNKLLVPTPCRDLSQGVCDQDGDDVPDYKQSSSIRAAFASFGDAPGGFSEELKEITIGTGLEYWYDDQFAVRVGYFYEHYSKGNRKYFNTGIGFKFNTMSINLSYLVPTTNQRNPLDNTLRFSLLFDLDSLSDEK